MLKTLLVVTSIVTLSAGLQAQTLSFTQATGSPYATGGNAPNTLTVADFNQDGVLDVITANSGSQAYTAWLGLRASGKPNGTLGNAAGTVGTATSLPFYFPGFENNPGPGVDRAVNVAARRAVAGYTYGCCGSAFYPAIIGGSLTTRYRNGSPWNLSLLNNFYSFGIGYTDLGHSGTLNPSGGYTYWAAAGDFVGEGLDGSANTWVSSVDSTTPLNYVSVMFGSASNPQFVDQVGAITVTMPAGKLAKRVFVGDVNGDGKADLVVTTGTNEVVIFLSQSTIGTGSAVHALVFGPAVTVNISQPSQFVTIADINGDRKADLVVSTGTSTLTILPGNGDGTFGSPADITLPAGTSLSAAVADFSHDGIADIAVANGANILVYPGTGGGSFGTPQSIAAGGSPVWVIAADMNQDGKPDLVAANSAQATVAVLLNSTSIVLAGPNSLTFHAAVDGSNPPSQNVAVAFDSGGTPTYTTTASAAWLSSNPTNGSTSPITVSVNITGLAAGTYHGTLTIATSSATNTSVIAVTLVVAGPSGTLVRQLPGVNPALVIARHGDTIVATGDFTGHGRLDLVGAAGCNVSALCLYTYPSNGDGTFGAELTNSITTNFIPGYSAVGDFNGDGKLDIAAYNVANGALLRIFYGDGAGHFTMGGDQYTLGPGSADVKAADLNNDGRLDLIVANYGGNSGFAAGTINVLINNGDGSFTNNSFAAAGAFSLAIGDFNRDGIPDFVVASIFSSSLYYQGTGGGGFAAPVTIATTAISAGGSYDLVAGDFNNDGNLDVAVGFVNSGKIAILLGNGAGAFSQATGSPYSTVGSVLDIQTADYDGDGNLDLVFHRTSQGSFTVMMGDGTGQFARPTDFPASNNASSASHIFTGDFNGDGKCDALVPDSTGWTLWLGDKTATTTTITSNPATKAPQGQSVAFSGTVTTTVPSWAIATGQVTITDNPDGQVGQGPATAGVFTTNSALSLNVHSLTGSYAGDSRTKASGNGAAYPFTVFQAHLTYFTAPATTSAGVAMANIVVKVLDPSNAVVGNSTVPVTIALDHNSISSGTTTVNAVAGVATFTNIKINLTGAYTMTASSTGLASANAGFNITAGALAQFAVAGFPSPATVNAANSFTVTAQDAGANTITGYTGTAHFTSSDGAATLPANYTFVAGDNGVHTFSATLKTAGTQSITATDTVTASITGSQTGIVVGVGVPAALTPTGTPQSAAVNTNYAAMSVTLTDGGGNPVNGQTITFTAPGSGASGLFGASLTTTTVTNASGIATVPLFTANTIAGTFNLHASLGGISTNFVLTNLAGAVNSISIQTGDNQSTAINTLYPTALSVLAVDVYSNPVPGVAVAFTMPAPGATATFPSAQAAVNANTNSSGIATAPALTANGTAGAIAGATAVTGALSVNFKLTNLTGSPAHLNITAGNSQSTLIATQFATQFTANVTDAGNNPIQNVVVSFTAPSSGKSGTFPGSLLTITATTDSSGNAKAPFFTANTLAGAYNVVAAANGLTANLGLTNLPGPALMTIVQGDPQSAVISSAFTTPLTVKIADSFGNPYPGVSVTFAPTGAAATATFTGTATVPTSAAGLAVAPTLTANNQVGPYTVVASSTSPVLTQTFNLTNTFGPPAILTATAGTPQSTLVGTAFTTPLSVKVTDSGLNPLAGVTVTFTAPASGASGVFSNSTATITAVTNGSGIASAPITANTVANTYAVSATFPALTPATYSLTNTPGPAILTINGGNNQSAVTSAAFATLLSAKVADSFGNPYNGTSVTFTAPASGPSGTFANATVTTTTATNASGIATATAFTANSQLGSYTATAASAGLTSVNYSLANITGPPVNVVTLTGTPQSTVVSTAFATAFSVKITDIAGNPLNNVFVTFAAVPVGNGAAGAFTGSASISTNASGIAVAPTFTANTVAGAYTVRATVNALTGTFNLTNLPGPPAIMTPTGTPQSAILNTAYNQLSVRITDASNNPISGLNVTFSANPVSGASGIFPGSSATATAATDSNGNAVAPTFTANGTLGAFAIRAASGSLSSNFALTNIVNPPVAILAISGSGQFAQVGSGFAQPLTAKVLDANGNGLNNISVTFTLPAAGASAAFSGSGTSFTAVTNSQGFVVTPALTANATSGVFNATATAGALQTTFSLTIGNPPQLTVDPAAFFFRYDVGLAPPPAQTATVDNAFGLFTVTGDASWVKPHTLSNGGYPYGISISVDPTGLAAGTYTANVLIFPAGSRQSATVKVTLVVVPAPQIGSGPTNLTFRYLQGQPVPPEQTDSIIGLSRNIAFTLATELSTPAKAKWLNVVAGNNVTTTPAVLHVSVAPIGLDAGTYQGVIHVIAPEATNSPYDIGVTLIVTAPVMPPAITSIVNAASFQNNSVSGNEILSMFGTNLACPAGPQVLVDSVPALVLGGTATQVNWVAPDLGGRAKIQVQFACGATVSEPYSMPVTTVVPGVFTSDGKQVAAYNVGFTLNGPAIPIARGQVIMLFGTGFGPLSDPDAKGLQWQNVPVTVTVGGIPATLTFSGAAPGLPGVNQINVLIPADAPVGSAVSLVVNSGAAAAPTSLAVAVN